MAFGWLVELFALTMLSPFLLLPVGVISLVITGFGRVHDPVRVGRLATLVGVASVVVPAIVFYRVIGW